MAGSAPSKAAVDFVDTTVSDNKVAVFSKTYCPFCTKAKNALSTFKGIGKNMEIVELDTREDGAALQAAMAAKAGARSVPQVFVGGKCIGGGDDTARLHATGDLEKLLKEAGAIE